MKKYRENQKNKINGQLEQAYETIKAKQETISYYEKNLKRTAKWQP